MSIFMPGPGSTHPVDGHRNALSDRTRIRFDVRS